MPSITSTSRAAQHDRILGYWANNPHMPLTRFTAISDLNVCQLPARIFELKERGYEIVTHRQPAHDNEGRQHPNISHYVLVGFTTPETSEVTA